MQAHIYHFCCEESGGRHTRAAQANRAVRALEHAESVVWTVPASMRLTLWPGSTLCLPTVPTAPQLAFAAIFVVSEGAHLCAVLRGW